ncbi:MAG: ABC transporter permease [Acidobacteriota bacterium]
MKELLKKLLPLLGFLFLFVLLSILSPYFLTLENLSSVARQTAVINIIAIGMTLVIIAGGIDLSVGSILAFSGICGTLLMERGLGPVPATFAGIVAGLLCGSLNGLVITQFRVPPFIATLGSLGMIRGLTLLVTNGIPITDVPNEFGRLGDGNLLYWIPVPLCILVVVALLMAYILRYTRLGRYAYAIGGNRESAYLSGINLTFNTLVVYTILGALTGLAGMIEASRLVTGQPTAGEGYELRVIAAVVIGGGSLSGGQGTVLGTTIGAFVMSLLSNGCNLLGISPFIQQILIGSIIVLAVAADEYRRRLLGATRT